MHKHILIATDGSALAQKGVAAGLALARSFGAKVTAVTVSEPATHLVPDAGFIDLPEAEEDAARAILDAVADAAQEADIACDTLHVANQYPAEAILKTAEARGCDMIVMASHGRRAIGRMLLGGEAVRVITQANVPVLVCK
jgi:nucleotide-binding universal stress UspA family protein